MGLAVGRSWVLGIILLLDWGGVCGQIVSSQETTLRVTNEGVYPVAVEIWGLPFEAEEPWFMSRLAQIAPGETRQLQAGALTDRPFQGTLWIRADGPLSVQAAQEGTPSTHSFPVELNYTDTSDFAFFTVGARRLIRTSLPAGEEVHVVVQNLFQRQSDITPQAAQTEVSLRVRRNGSSVFTETRNIDPRAAALFTVPAAAVPNGNISIEVDSDRHNIFGFTFVAGQVFTLQAVQE